MVVRLCGRVVVLKVIGVIMLDLICRWVLINFGIVVVLWVLICCKVGVLVYFVLILVM